MRTPGNWKAHGAEIIADGIIYIGTPGNRHLPDVHERIAEREANARLMAAAPEMLEALLLTQNFLVSIDTDLKPVEVPPLAEKLLGTVLAALKKARGES